jgi:hypothetical protein
VIGISTILVAALLLILLFLFERRRGSVKSQLPIKADDLLDNSDGDASAEEPCPAEFTSRIFSGGDWRFVSQMQSARLENVFHRERRGVALLWVRQTCAAVRRIMQEHTDMTRRSEDLNVTTEMKIFARYGELLLICAALTVLIRVAGPLWLHGLALHANKLSERIVSAEHALRGATRQRLIGTELR